MVTSKPQKAGSSKSLKNNRMWGRIREGDSLEEKMIRSTCWSFNFSERTSPHPSELNCKDVRTPLKAWIAGGKYHKHRKLCVGIFWSDFKAGVRTELTECDKRTKTKSIFSNHPLKTYQLSPNKQLMIIKEPSTETVGGFFVEECILILCLFI